MDFLNTPEKRERRLVHVPMGRFGEAIEQAKAVLFCMLFIFWDVPHLTRFISLTVASDDSSYITVRPQWRPYSLETKVTDPSIIPQGTDFVVDGGISSAYVTPLGEPLLPPPVGLAPK